MNSDLSQPQITSPIMDTIEKSMSMYNRLSNVTIRSRSLVKQYDLPFEYDSYDFDATEGASPEREQVDKKAMAELSVDHSDDASNHQGVHSQTLDDQSCVDSDDGDNNEDSDDSEDDLNTGQQQILNFLKGMNSELTDRLNEIDSKVSNIETFTNKVPSLERQIDEVKQENAILKKEICSMKTKYDTLFERQLALETYSRKDNLVFHGVPFVRNENCGNKIREIMKVHMKIDVAIVNDIRFHRCHRLPGKGDRIICSFSFGDQRDLVWENRFALKGTKIFVTEHFPMEVENRRKKLYPIAKAAKLQKMKAIVKYDKLIIDGTKYDHNDLSDLPKSLSPPPSTKTTNGITCFFTGASPLSNFHVVEGGITIDGGQYDTIERYFQMRKATFAEKTDAVAKIKSAKTAAECKRIGDSLTVNNDHWFPEAKKAMHKACMAKFSQYPDLKKFLLETGNTTLAESGPNKIWGIGLHIDHPDAFVKNKWQGANTLGVILMDVRQKICSRENSLEMTPGDEQSDYVRL